MTTCSKCGHTYDNGQGSPLFEHDCLGHLERRVAQLEADVARLIAALLRGPEITDEELKR